MCGFGLALDKIARSPSTNDKRRESIVRCLVLVAALLLGGLVSFGDASSPRPQKKTAELMRAKLTHSQKLLEGVTMHDFKIIEKHAEELIDISKAAEWKVLKTPQYEMYSNDLRRIAGEMIENAKKKNGDAAALNYVDLTLTCVKCHKHVRDTRMTRR